MGKLVVGLSLYVTTVVGSPEEALQGGFSGTGFH